ncbi:MAG TPA: FMN-binding negative transcriptional regulator [Acidisphaera sp.]|nr:FMN-binding negative transcriptional regulator [Acidisphaera sp.]
MCLDTAGRATYVSGMYLPPAFREDDVAVLHDAIRRIRFGALVTVDADGVPDASHVPMLVDPDPAPYGTLIGHLARANPMIRATGTALAIFGGPNAYVTPSWYASKREHGKVVPTWNYVAVHATGPIEMIDDADALHAIVKRLTETHEAGRPAPWAVSDAPADFMRGQLKGIVGFRIPIARLEGKWKMSQNRPPADREGVVAGLAQEAPEVAALIPRE